ncbi:response regulator transcription factor [Enterococcus hermanniensis]|uniref:Heme response regulator HssR n=1 Tax=Enterococcus hermanniensis TaxID=249189 RepID=A0A1L8TQW5_9ENTE|nr:response regulator transcription factor [Enterococcus hermanniensis]OJG46670.1 transcriptional regulator [Enterococcus hermanniensis]
MVNVLVVEDDERLNRIITTVIENDGYEVRGFLSAMEALDEMEQTKFDIIISDIMMPGMDGFSFATMIRAVDSKIPILFMSARDDSLSKEKGFRLGIDDYLVKPINPEEILWRIKAILRRANILEQEKISIGEFSMDKKSVSARYKNEEFSLTNREFNLLYKLLSYPNQAFSRAKLMDEFWGFESDSTLRSVDVYITKLRNKLVNIDEFKIKTVYGVGYKVVLQNEK